MTKLSIALAALACCTAAPALAAETINATFTQADGGVTTRAYSGIVRVTVSGTGNSNGDLVNDAFYFTPSGTFDSTFYQLTFGTSTLQPVTPSQNAVNYIVGGRPVFNANNTYSFLLNTGTATPSTLHFGVGDGVFGDNGGSFAITVAVPEPAVWGMMILGFGVVGGALRQRRAAKVSFA